jgi:hypothetical protein
VCCRPVWCLFSDGNVRGRAWPKCLANCCLLIDAIDQCPAESPNSGSSSLVAAVIPTLPFCTLPSRHLVFCTLLQFCTLPSRYMMMCNIRSFFMLVYKNGHRMRLFLYYIFIGQKSTINVYVSAYINFNQVQSSENSLKNKL